MTQLLDIFGFLSVLLRGLTLAFEAMTVGGVLYLLVIARNIANEMVNRRLTRWVRWFATGLAITQACYVAANSAILIGSTDLQWSDVSGAGFAVAGSLTTVGALMIAALARTKYASVLCPLACAFVMAGSIMTSHSVARIEHRSVLLTLTSMHHAASAAWIGGMPYLLVALRHSSPSEGAAMASRFSRLAIVSVITLTGAGAGLSYFYVSSPPALTGTIYGVMLLSKITLTLLLLFLGALNFSTVRAIRMGLTPILSRLGCFAEVEVGIGFTVLLAAASLTSTPPAADVQADRVSASAIVERFSPQWPRMETPAVEELSPVTPLSTLSVPSSPGSFVPGQSLHPSTAADIAWSEYNHHWAGLVVLAIGIVSLLVVRFSWARNWPLLFLGLALFLLIRADSENWPLGPRGFWESFQVAEVAQHRFFVLLIIGFAIFEWSVQTGRLAPRRAGLVFPFVCAAGGALLLTHSHSLGNVKEEFLAELSHLPLAILAVMAGWSRWLEIRFFKSQRNPVKWIWPVCFVLIGVVLLNYRES